MRGSVTRKYNEVELTAFFVPSLLDYELSENRKKVVFSEFSEDFWQIFRIYHQNISLVNKYKETLDW